MQTTNIISDITGKMITSDHIHVFKDFGYNTDFDCSHLSIDTTQDEIEELFGKKFDENTTDSGFCSICHANLIEPAMTENHMYPNGLSGVIERIHDQTLTIDFSNEQGTFEINLCENCWKKYFEKYIQSDESEYDE